MNEVDRIAGIYEKTLDIPTLKPDPQFYLIPVGLVGSGKSTVLRPLSEKLHLLRISGDEIRKVIQDNGGDLDDTWEVGNLLVLKYSQKGYSIAHDTDGATPRTQKAIAKQAYEHHLKVIWIHINPPESFIINKLTHYKHDWLFTGSEEAIAAYYSRKSLHENLEMNFTYVFDTSASNLEWQVEQAILAIRHKLQSR